MILSVWRGGVPPLLPQMGPELGKRGSYSATYGPPKRVPNAPRNAYPGAAETRRQMRAGPTVARRCEP